LAFGSLHSSPKITEKLFSGMAMQQVYL